MQANLIQEILKRPDAVLQSQYLQEVLKDEKKRRLEFREWVNEAVKAEFINGEIVIHSPVKRRHWKASNLLVNLLTNYVNTNDLGEIGSEKVMISLSRNDYEPDIVFFSKEKANKFKEDQLFFPAPDFVVEILSPSTEENDKTTKKEDYALHGIREYWIIDPVKYRVEQFLLFGNDKQYFPGKLFQSGYTIESKVIKGFKIPVNAIFEKEENIKALQNLLK